MRHLRLGFDDYLVKPVSLGKLREVVTNVEQRLEERLKVATGKIKKIVPEKGFGFIAAANGKDVFFHHSSVANGGFDNLAQGQEVEFEVDQDGRDRGKDHELARSHRLATDLMSALQPKSNRLLDEFDFHLDDFFLREV